MSVKVRVEGLREVEQALSELKTATARSVGLKALRAGGEILARAARGLAPKDEMHLSESIDVGTKLTKRQAGLHVKESDLEVFVGPNDPAAIQQEFGNFKDAPQPFLRPAWDETKDQVLQRIADELMVGVDQAVAKARAKALKGP
jgi:HK97 gp10 family phage protein